MGFLAGFECRLYRNGASVNTWDSPSWVEVKNVRDLAVRVLESEVDFPVRGRNRWSAPYRGIQRATLEWEMAWDHDDADVQVFRDAWINDLEVDMIPADGDIVVSGTQGLRAEWGIVQMSQPQNLNGLVVVSFVAAPSAWTDNGPIWFETP